jgi:endoglucanase
MNSRGSAAFSLIMGFVLLLAKPLSAQYLSQVGFEPGTVQRIFFDADYQQQAFQIIDQQGREVYNGWMTESQVWPHSGTSVCFADFSDYQEEGKFLLVVKDHQKSVGFVIEKGLYKQVGKSLVKTLYHARASMPISEKHGGVYQRPMGHPDTEVIVHPSAASQKRPAGSVISSPGGWYDAGDYGKYIVNSGISTYTLLHLEDLFAEDLMPLTLNIPESGNGLSDVLNETLYNLRWMMTMQDPEDGGVYHKLTSKKFCGMIMPHEDELDRYVVMKSTAATLDFAATMAKAHRVLEKSGKTIPGLADSCLTAAKKAWKWCLKNPAVLYNQPTDIKTGQYKDADIQDEWFWAATELYLSTSDKSFVKKVDYSTTRFTIPQWRHVGTLGLFSILTSGAIKEDDPFHKRARKKLVNLADAYWEVYQSSAFRISIHQFPWGSNGEVANQGMVFIHAYRLTNDERYLQAATACVGYLMGANPLDMCFVTGFGDRHPMNVHERRSHADGIKEPVPGILAGGPTRAAMQDCGKENYPSEYPALSYVDRVCSYSTNEIAINWNTAAAFLFLGLDATLNSK